MKRTIGDCLYDRKNNYDFIRFIAALLVIVSHAYPLTSHENEFFLVWSNGQMDLGRLAVATFFVISGFLITQSYNRTPDIIKYFKARILRIFPALIVAALFGTFVIGLLVTTLPKIDYLTNSNTYNYLKVIFLFPMQWTLPGVFESSSLNNSINGSLWTLPFEILSYIVVAILGIFGALKSKKLILFIFLLSMYVKNYLIVYIPTHFSFVYLPSFFDLFPFFAAGMVLYAYKDSITINKQNALISLALLIISFIFGGFTNIFTIFGAYLIIYLAYNTKVRFYNFAKYGDFSYGLYIYAFPIQQAVTYYFGGEISVLTNIAISVPLTIFISFISWHMIEKPAMKLKNVKIIKRVNKEASTVS